jgi:hypothetical protein
MSNTVAAGTPLSTPTTAWWRFPSTWIVGSPTNEALFSKGAWLILPLQYYVLSKFNSGLNGEYIAVALVSVVSIASLFGASLVFALAYYRRKGPNSDEQSGTSFRTRYASGVRMWAIALIVSWMGVYAVLAVAYGLGGESDLLEELLCNRYGFLECNGIRPSYSILTLVEYVAYTVIAVALLAIAGVIHRRFNRFPTEKITFREPNLLYVIITVVTLLFLINNSTVVR